MFAKIRYIGIFSAIAGLLVTLITFGANYFGIIKTNLSSVTMTAFLLALISLIVVINYSGVNLLRKMCKTSDFDEDEAIKLCKDIDLTRFFIYNHDRYPEKFLEIALHHRNSEMINILLKSGVNPNIGENVNFEFFELRHPEKSEIRNNKKLIILNDMLYYGADPNIVSKTFRKNLFSCAYQAIFKETKEEEHEYYKKFFVLLTLYGGKSEDCEPKFVEDPDYENIWQYELTLLSEKDHNGFNGFITDGSNNIIAYI